MNESWPRAPLTSTPALGAALRQGGRGRELPGPMRSVLRGDPPVQMYRIPAGTVDEEAQAAAHVMLAVADRLRRLRSAYGEWRQFDACAYFDLTEAQAARLVRVVERVTTMHVTFFADLLLPSFQTAEAFWQERYRPCYRDLQRHLYNGRAPLEPVMTFADHCRPQMIDHWNRLLAVIAQARSLLDDELSFWAAHGGGEERARWRRIWQLPPAPGVDPALLPDLNAVPTLTLTVDFPLPIYRQPGRLRRLRAHRARHPRRQRAGSL
ncbi:MAG: hypothetical protein IT329_03260 [Caldilineaceae bacterium]|nr:hypothetical protein [Caldilineaceae bacterium]